MTSFSNRRQERYAPYVLAIWLFALAVGIAHACGLGAHLAGLNHGEGFAATQAGDSLARTTPACEKFCADDASLLVKVAAVQDSPAGSALLVAARLGDASFAVAARPRVRAASPDPPPNVAINTRFVRLAL